MSRAGGAAILVLSGLVLAAPALGQTRTTGQKPPTTSAPPPTTSGGQSSGQPTRTMPSMPVDPGSMTGMPSSGSTTRTGPDYGPMGPTGTRTTRPRRSADPPPDSGSGDEIPYVDPPAAPGYGTAADAPMRTAGGKPPPTGSHTVAPPPPATPTASGAAAPATTSPAAPVPVPPSLPAGAKDAVPVDPPATPPPLDRNLLWMALAGLAAMLVAAGLGLRHILAAPHLGFRVTVDHGVQSAPRFKGETA